ncbi:MAG: S8 family peptidase, partial [Roseimicrobium sp.]
MRNKSHVLLLWLALAIALGVELFFLLQKRPAAAARFPSSDRLAQAPVELGGKRGQSLPQASSGAFSSSDLQMPNGHYHSADPFSLKALQEAAQPPGAVRDEVLLTFGSAEAYADFLSRARAAGLSIKAQLDELQAVRVGFTSIEQLQAALRALGNPDARVSANYPVEIPGLPPAENRTGGGDVPFGDTVLNAIGINPESDRAAWGQGVTVAVLDSGVGAHPAFREGQVTHLDLVNDGKAFNGHGTAIASLIAGGVSGAQGVAPGAKVLDIRVADGEGNSDSFQLARGITTALSQGAKVINISMGSNR